MQDSSQTSFLDYLRQQGLIEKALAIGASWPYGHIAQNSFGEIYIYNGHIKPGISGWQRLTPASEVLFHELGHLKKTGDWKDLAIPTRALWQPVSGLEPAQQHFLKRLQESNLAARATSFIDSWKQECWIVMDANGGIDLYNLPPIQASGFWHMPDSEVSSWYRLGTFQDHHLDWAKCAVTINKLRQPDDMSHPIDFDRIDRVDCWL